MTCHPERSAALSRGAEGPFVLFFGSSVPRICGSSVVLRFTRSSVLRLLFRFAVFPFAVLPFVVKRFPISDHLFSIEAFRGFRALTRQLSPQTRLHAALRLGLRRTARFADPGLSRPARRWSPRRNRAHVFLGRAG